MPPLDVHLEIGTTRVFATAVEWPGWSRSGRDEDAAIDALLAYGPRYARALGAAARGLSVARAAPSVGPTADSVPIDESELERLVVLLRACWSAFDAAVESAVGVPLVKGPRGGGRDLPKSRSTCSRERSGTCAGSVASSRRSQAT